MALTGLQIQKILPGTNCKECGSNTCLAFAMKLAAKKAEIKECPYASEEAVRTLGEATEPPVRKLKIGATALGDETVLYRHEKTFVSRTAMAVDLHDEMTEAEIVASLERITSYRYERVGEIFGVDMISLTQKKSKEAFLAMAAAVRKKSDLPVILRSDDIPALTGAASLFKGKGAVLVSNDAAMTDVLLPACREGGHLLALSGSVDGIASQTAKLRDGGFTDILLDFGTATPALQFQLNSIARAAAIRDGVKPLGFPFIRFMDRGDQTDIIVSAATEILKYGGILVLPEFDPALMAALFTLRLNIFTDPQKPIQVDPKIYPVGEPDGSSPVFVTTNFSLTYFVVSGEIENSGSSAWLLVPECEGMSVLTAWAAGKFNARVIAAGLKESGMEEKMSRRRIVIPGYVSQLSGELEELLPGWEVLVGPQEAADIESFVKTRLAG